MKTLLLLLLLLVGGTFNVPAQVKKDTVLISDSVAHPKLYDSSVKKYYCNYKGKKVRAAKSDKGKRAFVIYNTNAAGERKISKIYYAN